MVSRFSGWEQIAVINLFYKPKNLPVGLQQIKVTLNDEDMDTFVFAVGTKKAMARLQKEMQDLVNILL